MSQCVRDETLSCNLISIPGSINPANENQSSHTAKHEIGILSLELRGTNFLGDEYADNSNSLYSSDGMGGLYLDRALC